MLATLLLVSAPHGVLGSHPLSSRAAVRAPRAMRSASCMAADVNRRDALALAAAAIPAAALLGAPGTALAGDSKANRLLVSLGFAPLSQTDGFTGLAEFIGRGAANIDGQKTRGFTVSSPLLVAYNYPSSWVTAMPTITTNGESGTVSAGNYIKGDSSGFVAIDAGSAKSMSEVPKALLAESVVTSATGDVYQDIKVSKVQPRPGGGDYATWDYTYTLLTRAGFEVDRHGVAAGTLVNGQLCAVITATTQLRWKSEEAKLRELAKSFVVYPVKKSAIPQIGDLDA